MKHAISLAVFLFLLWLGLSGHTDALLVSLGVASVTFTVYLSLRMDRLDREEHPLQHLSRHLIPIARFWIYLLGQVIRSNIDVAVRILKPGNTISPQMVELPLPQKTDIGRVTYANSNTLTPGTVSVRLDETGIKVHALTREAVEDLARGDLARAVPDDLEPRPAESRP